MEWRRRSFICHHDLCMDNLCLHNLWCTAMVLMQPFMVCIGGFDGFSGMESIVLSWATVWVTNRIDVRSMMIKSMANAQKSWIKL